MRALQLVAPSEFALVDLPTPEIADDEVLVRVAACGICGSDVHGMDGRTGRRIPPIVMGHEAAGTITEVGARVQGWSVGDRVTFDSTVYCGACAFCLAGRINLCENRRVLGVSCDEYRQNGAFAESVAVPARILYRLPDGMPFERAAFVEPVAIALHAVNRAGIQKGESAAVIGVGMIGLLVVQALRERGAGRIVAVDLDPRKLDLARELGATETVVGGEELRLTEPVNVALEVVGATVTIRQAVENVRRGGRVVLVGNLSPKAEIPLQMVVNRELDLRGSAASCGEYPEALATIADGRIRVEPLLVAETDLDGAADWFARLHADGSLMKVMVKP